MTEHEYKAYLHRLALAASVISDVPIAGLRNHLTHAETLGPILEPTAWMRGGADNLAEHGQLLTAAAPLVAFGRELDKKREALERACPKARKARGHIGERVIATTPPPVSIDGASGKHSG